MESKHTPGPWTAYKSESPRGGFWAIGTAKATLALLSGSALSAEVIANAYLMAAAPDLLKVCRAFVEEDDKADADDIVVDIDRLSPIIRAAIAKAEGK